MLLLTVVLQQKGIADISFYMYPVIGLVVISGITSFGYLLWLTKFSQKQLSFQNKEYNPEMEEIRKDVKYIKKWIDDQRDDGK